MNETASQDTIHQLMRWYVDAGVDESITDSPVDRFAEEVLLKAEKQAAQSNPAPVNTPAKVSSVPVGAEEAMHDAVHLAATANTVDELQAVIEGFEGCPLKKSATNLVFLDGNKDSRILLIGGAPGTDEDRQGIPFSGQNGVLFDQMIGSIGLDRSKILLSSVVFWRPPGNRTPTQAEISVCMPFVERLIEIVDPHVLIAVGENAARVLLAQKQAIGRLRGKWHDYSLPGLPRPIDLMAINGPRVLLNSPIQKREAWQDLLLLKKKLTELAE
jgi:uracil-DNA glycosylase